MEESTLLVIMRALERAQDKAALYAQVAQRLIYTPAAKRGKLVCRLCGQDQGTAHTPTCLYQQAMER